MQNTFHHAWNVLANRDANGGYILPADRLPLIHTAVLTACDSRDGPTDGVVDDPRRCDFDPDTLRCTAGPGPGDVPDPGRGDGGTQPLLRGRPGLAEGRERETGPLAHATGAVRRALDHPPTFGPVMVAVRAAARSSTPTARNHGNESRP
ncbi:tannase/feruloyl esterase family alpha/beta hydrolase [Dactylosporangium sp. McL0621]|uniref:tannase/feruloyl esterase family alpha/beta hydrolase n=1 Tax=Dactylosporangium sp. McL0621 TaxID=3415678 RepID=UPI003CEA097B